MDKDFIDLETELNMRLLGLEANNTKPTTRNINANLESELDNYICDNSKPVQISSDDITNFFGKQSDGSTWRKYKEKYDNPTCFDILKPTKSVKHDGPVVIDSRLSLLNYCHSIGIPIAKFNEPVVIPYGTVDCSMMFAGCVSFNQCVEIPDTVVNCDSMFRSCFELNSKIKMSNFVSTADSMFIQCIKFNKPIQLPESLMYCTSMFFKCFEFNQSIIIPDNIKEYNDMFCCCDKLRRPIYVPKSIKDIEHMFNNKSINYDIIFK